MERLKLVQRVPPNAANMGYIKNEPAAPVRNISLIDFSSSIPENSTDINIDRAVPSQYGLGGPVTFPPQMFVSAHAVVPSFDSAVDTDVMDPTPLYYVHMLGKGPRQESPGRRYAVLVEDAGYTDVIANEIYRPTETNQQSARMRIKGAVEVIDESGNPATDIAWDIRFAEGPEDSDGVVYGVYQDDYEPIGYFIDILTNRPCSMGKTYFIRYHAYDIETGETLPNHTEVLNGIPQPLVEDGYTRLCGDDKFPIVARCTNSPGYYLCAPTGIAPASAPGVGLFSKYDPAAASDRWELDLDGTPFRVNDTASGASYDLDSGPEVSPKDLCAEMNSLDGSFIAVPLSPYSRCYTLNTVVPGSPGGGLGVSDPYSARSGRLENDPNFVFHYKHRPDRRIRPLLPMDYTPMNAWYPRVSAGEFAIVRRHVSGNTRTYVEFNYGIPEHYREQEWSSLYGPYAMDVMDEDAQLAGKRIIRTKNYPVYSFDSIEVKSGDREIIAPIDADLENGKVFFSRDISSAPELSVSYAYRNDTFHYRRINLNPTHVPGNAGKYVGLYIIPQEIRLTSGTMADGDIWSGLSEEVLYPASYAIEPSNPVVYFTSSQWSLQGVKLGANTSRTNSLHCYYSQGSNYLEFRIYSIRPDDGLPSAKYMVARARVLNNGGDINDWVLVHEENSSGLTGKFYLVHPAAPVIPSSWGYMEVAIHDLRQCVHHVVGDSVSEVEDAIATAAVFDDPRFGTVPVARLLGIYHIAPSLDADDVETIDSRSRGGGLLDEVDPRNLEESSMNWDVGNFDGEPFQSAGAIVVQMPSGFVPGTGVPSGILTGFPDPSGWMNANNILTEEQIRGMIDKYLALGIYPIVDYLAGVEGAGGAVELYEGFEGSDWESI